MRSVLGRPPEPEAGSRARPCADFVIFSSETVYSFHRRFPAGVSWQRSRLHNGLLQRFGIFWTCVTSHQWKDSSDAEGCPRHHPHLAVWPTPEMGANTLKRAVDHSEVGSNVDSGSDDHGWSPVRDSQWSDGKRRYDHGTIDPKGIGIQASRFVLFSTHQSYWLCGYR